MTSKYSVRIQNARGEVTQLDLVNGGAPGVVHITGPVRVELVDLLSQRGPQIVRTKRVGKNLEVAIEGDTDQRADVILENYYGNDGNLLQGLAEDQRYYDYVPTSGDNSAIVALLADGSSAQQALGELIYGVYGNAAFAADGAAAAAGLGAGAGAGSLFGGWGIAPYLGLAALGAGAAGLYATTRDGNDSQTTTDSNTSDNTGGTNGGKTGPTTDVNDQGSGGDKTPPNNPVVKPSNGKTVSGSSEPGSTVKVYDPSGALVGTGVTGTDGKYTITLSTPQPHNTTIQVNATDSAGNTSGKTATTVDAFTAAVTLALTSDTGVSATDRITSQAEITTTGKDSDATVAYSVNGGAYGNYVPPSVDGVYTIVAKTTDTLGNTNTSTPLIFTRDTTTAAPTLALTSDTGVADNKVSSLVDLTTTGKDADASVSYSVNGGAYGNYVPPSTDGVYTVVARTTDTAGNTNTSTPFVFTRDTTTSKPTLGLVIDSTDGLAGHDSDGITNNVALSVGNTEAGSTVSYSLNGGAYGNYVPPTVDGVYTVVARSTDSAGNTHDSTPLVFTRDTSVGTPTIALTSDSGSSATDRWTNTSLLTTTSDASSHVTYSINGGQYGAYNAPTVDGIYTVLAKAVDAAGNTSVSQPLVFTLDTTTSKPVLSLLVDSSNDAVLGSDSDNRSNDVRVRAAGTEAGATVSYSLNGGAFGNYTPPTTDGVYTLIARSIDAAGNANDSNAFVFTRDTSTSTPTLKLSTDTGSSASDNISSISLLDTNNVETGSSLSYSINGGAYGAYTAPTVDGVYTVTVRSIDVAGNSAVSQPLIFTRDTATTKPSLALSLDTFNPDMPGTATDRLTSNSGLNITNVAAGDNVSYQVNGSAFGNYVQPTVDGIYTVVARSTDIAGNTADSDALVFTFDGTRPVFSSGNSATVAENTANTTVVYDAQAQDNGGAVDTNLTYTLSGPDAALFNINPANGQVTFKTAPDFERPLDASGNNIYDITVNAMDRAGNVASRDVAISVTNVAEKGDTVIDLGSNGKLIAPVNVDGKWFYHWDRDGDGVADTGDEIAHHNYGVREPNLDELFNQQLVNGNLVARNDGLNYTTNDTRFAEINGIKLALPTAFGTTGSYDSNPTVRTNEYLDGTAIGSNSLNTGDASINTKYDDYAAIWDAFNGKGTFTGSPSNPAGMPPNWIQTPDARYWTATKNNETDNFETSNDATAGAAHYYIHFQDGLVTSWWDQAAIQGQRDSFKYYVALEML